MRGYFEGRDRFLPRRWSLAVRNAVMIAAPVKMYATVNSFETSLVGVRSPNPTVVTATALK